MTYWVILQNNHNIKINSMKQWMVEYSFEVHCLISVDPREIKVSNTP